MRKHERATAAARAGVVTARALALPVDDPDLGVDHEWEKHIERIERGIADERDARVLQAEEDRKLHEAVASLLRTVKILVPAVIVLFIASTIVYAFANQSIRNIARENRRLGLANAATQLESGRQARIVIRQSCERQNDRDARLRTIVLRGEASITALEKEGTLTPMQADRARLDSRRAIRDLQGDDCDKLARRIPITEAAVP